MHLHHPSITDEDLGPLSHHRLTVPAAMWMAALVFACMAALFDGAPAAPEAAAEPPAPTAAVTVPGQG